MATKNKKRAIKSHLDYTERQVARIEQLVIMCVDINGTELHKVSAVFKLAFISGVFRREDTAAMLKHSPFLMNIIIGGLNTNLQKFKFKQMFSPFTTREVCDALLHYEPLIRDEHIKWLKRALHAEKVNPLAAAISSNPRMENRGSGRT